MQILIKVRSLQEIIDIGVETGTNSLYIGSKKYNKDVSNFVLRLLSIIRSWPENLLNPAVVGGESYTVSIREGEKEKRYVGVNEFPENYHEFKKLISEVLNG